MSQKKLQHARKRASRKTVRRAKEKAAQQQAANEAAFWRGVLAVARRVGKTKGRHGNRKTQTGKHSLWDVRHRRWNRREKLAAAERLAENQVEAYLRKD